MLNRNEFLVLRSLEEEGEATQRALADRTGISVGSVNAALRSLAEGHFVEDSGRLTDVGYRALQPFKTQNAIILAAGLSTRFAPLSFEQPKALFKVRGETLIERLIKQLQGAGLENIAVVVGHMKERFFYLEDRYGVTIIDNPHYLDRNNHASVWAARNFVGNGYICSSDQYYPNNPFHDYEYESFCTLTRNEAMEESVAVNGRGYIIGIQRNDDAHFDDHPSWVLQGPAFLREQDSLAYLAYLEKVYPLASTRDKLWETLLLENPDRELIAAHKVDTSEVIEFDYLGDLRSFDADFMENVDSAILDNICRTLECSRADIVDVEPLTEGITNLSVLFSCKGNRYVYRHPGAGTDALVNRKAETHAMEIAADLGLDTSYLYEDSDQGWKLSRFIPDCTPFDYRDQSHVGSALEAIRTLHKSGASSPWQFDFYEEGCRIADLLRAEGTPLPEDFEELALMSASLQQPMRAGAGAPVLCHNDFFGPNILIGPNGTCLIDWEYAAMGDYGCDLGNFIAQGSGYNVKEALNVLPLYFGRPATAEEEEHLLACTAIVGWYWYVWGLYKEAQGSPVGEWLRVWYEAAKTFGRYALKRIGDRAVNPAELTEDEFDALVAYERSDEATDVPETLVASLEQRGLLRAGAITAAGVNALEPFRARRAIFFAAGFGSRMLPITVNTPKPLVRVHGVRIIDRLLDAVLAAGISEIYIVRGYLKEEFDQLLSRYPMVQFIDNPLFDSTNNISSAVLAKDFFQNAYAFESDLLLENPQLVTKYQYRTNYLAFPVPHTPDWCFTADDEGRITSITKGSQGPCWQMVGLSYWGCEDGMRLSHDLAEVFESSDECRQIFWDDVALDRRPASYSVHVRPCKPEDITEIDTFAELQAIDERYRPVKEQS